MIDWLFTDRPGWLGALAKAWFLEERLPMPGRWVPHILGLWFGRCGHRVDG